MGYAAEQSHGSDPPCSTAGSRDSEKVGTEILGMAKLVYGLNQSLDGYVDHQKFATDPVIFRHFIEQVRGVTGMIWRRAPMWNTHRSTGDPVSPNEKIPFENPRRN